MICALVQDFDSSHFYGPLNALAMPGTFATGMVIPLLTNAERCWDM